MSRPAVAIIPCTNQKAVAPGPAREVWAGNHFQLVLAHAEAFYDVVLIMSYKYGLIDPDMEIEPYDINIKYATAKEKMEWWLMLRKQIDDLVKIRDPKLVALYTGNYERDRVIGAFIKSGCPNVIVPFSEASVGVRLQRVFEGDIPWNEEDLAAGKYERKIEFTRPKPRGRPPKPKLPPIIKSEDQIPWEE